MQTENEKKPLKLFQKRTGKEYIIYSVIIVAGIIIDQFTKWLAVKYLAPVKSIPIINEVLHLTYLENTGAAFGMLKDSRWVFMFSSTIMLVVLFGYLYLGFADNMLYAVSVAMIASGGIGNMIDRIFLGYVVDFIDFQLINFAVFNGADSFVCVGACLLVVVLIRDMIKEYREKKANANGGGADGKSGEADGKKL